MAGIVALVSIVCVFLVATYVIRVRKRGVSISYLENVSVSRQWLMQHQADDRS